MSYHYILISQGNATQYRWVSRFWFEGGHSCRWSAAALTRLPTQRTTRYPQGVSPTVLRVRGYRLYFFSREEPRAHVHVQHASGEAKFWLDPQVELA
ncbi:MAG: DUF4160 domain-containing protein [Gemmatimonadaceae bacterium]